MVDRDVERFELDVAGAVEISALSPIKTHIY